MPNFVKIIFCQKTNKGGIRHMKDFNVKFEESLPSNFIELSLSEIARQGAQQMLKLALEAEIEEFINSYKNEKTGNGMQRIVRNGYHQERSLQTGVGELNVSVPRYPAAATEKRIQWTKRSFKVVLYPVTCAGVRILKN